MGGEVNALIWTAAFPINPWYNSTYVLNNETGRVFLLDEDGEITYYVAITEVQFKDVFNRMILYELNVEPGNSALRKQYKEEIIEAAGGNEFRDYYDLIYPSSLITIRISHLFA